MRKLTRARRLHTHRERDCDHEIDQVVLAESERGHQRQYQKYN